VVRWWGTGAWPATPGAGKSRRILERLRMNPARATKLLRALLVLANLANHR
jgi:hypothetical protein